MVFGNFFSNLGSKFGNFFNGGLGSKLGNLYDKATGVYDAVTKIPVLGQLIDKSPIGMGVRTGRNIIDNARRVFQKPVPKYSPMNNYPTLD